MRSNVADALPADRLRRVVLCTLTLIDGRVIRAATAPVVVAANQGGPWLYDHMLIGIDDFVDEVDLYALDATASLTQVRVGIAATDDLGALSEAGVNLCAATAEVAHLWPGDAWEARVVLMAGSVQAGEIGRVGETTDFTLECAPVATGNVLGDDTRDVGTDYPAPLVDTGAAAMTDVSGDLYPIILGCPLSVAAIKVGNVGGQNRLIVAGHHLPDVGSVSLFEDGVADGTDTLANSSVTSGDICYAESAANYYSPEGATPGGAFTVAFARGGIACSDGVTRATKSAADVLRWLLANSGLRIDWPRMAPALAHLSGWPIGLAITTQTTHIEVARSIAKVLPLIEVPGANGLWFAYTDISALPIEGTLRLGHELAGGAGKLIVSDRDAVRNSFTMNYYDNRYSNTFEAALTVDATTHTLCALSKQWYETQADSVVDCRFIWDATTARRALNARADRVALQHRSRSYLLHADAYDVYAGRLVTLYDGDYGIANHLAYVRAVSVVAPLIATIDLIDRSPTSAF